MSSLASLSTLAKTKRYRKAFAQEGRRAATELRWPLLLLALLFAVSGLGLARSLLCLALAALFLWAAASFAERRVCGLPWWRMAQRIGSLPPSAQAQVVGVLDDLGRVEISTVSSASEGYAYRPAGHYGGARLLPAAAPTRATLSAKAEALGLHTRDDVEREYMAQAKGAWSHAAEARGAEWHCPLCDKDFWSPSGARKHMKRHGHPVLRWDWY